MGACASRPAAPPTVKTTLSSISLTADATTAGGSSGDPSAGRPGPGSAPPLRPPPFPPVGLNSWPPPMGGAAGRATPPKFEGE